MHVVKHACDQPAVVPPLGQPLPHGAAHSVQYTPSSNLAEVSDWLTKLLLGAGLVQLTRLGAPVAHLIDNIAAGLHSTAASASGAKVAAGAILFGYTITGILVGYVMTTLWYQRKITNQQTPITLT